MDTDISSTPQYTAWNRDLSGSDQLNLHCVNSFAEEPGRDWCMFFYGKSPALQVENNVNKSCISVDKKDNAVFR